MRKCKTKKSQKRKIKIKKEEGEAGGEMRERSKKKNKADRNALNLSAKGNAIRIIDGCKIWKRRKDESERAHLV